MQKEKIYLDILANGKPATKAMGKVEKSQKKLEKTTKKSTVNMKKSWVAYGAAIAGATVIMKKSIEAHGIQLKAETALASTLKIVRDEGDMSIDMWKDYASNLQKVTTYGDEVTLSLINQAKAFGRTDVQTRNLIQASANFASGTGMDIKTTFLLLNKSYEDGGTGLKRYGISIDEVTKKTAHLGSVVDKVGSIFAGQSKAWAKTSVGHIEQIKNAFGDLVETMGKGFADFLEDNSILDEFTISLEKFQEALDNKEGQKGLENLGNLLRNFLKVGTEAGLMVVKFSGTLINLGYAWATVKGSMLAYSIGLASVGKAKALLVKGATALLAGIMATSGAFRVALINTQKYMLGLAGLNKYQAFAVSGSRKLTAATLTLSKAMKTNLFYLAAFAVYTFWDDMVKAFKGTAGWVEKTNKQLKVMSDWVHENTVVFSFLVKVIGAVWDTMKRGEDVLVRAGQSIGILSTEADKVTQALKRLAEAKNQLDQGQFLNDSVYVKAYKEEQQILQALTKATGSNRIALENKLKTVQKEIAHIDKITAKYKKYQRVMLEVSSTLKNIDVPDKDKLKVLNEIGQSFTKDINKLTETESLYTSLVDKVDKYTTNISGNNKELSKQDVLLGKHRVHMAELYKALTASNIAEEEQSKLTRLSTEAYLQASENLRVDNLKELTETTNTYIEKLTELTAGLSAADRSGGTHNKFIKDLKKSFEKGNVPIAERKKLLEQVNNAYDTYREAEQLPDTGETTSVGNFMAGIKSTGKTFKEEMKEWEDAGARTVDTLADGFTKMAMGAKVSFKDMARSIIADLIRIQAKQLAVKVISAMFGFHTGTAEVKHTGGAIGLSQIPSFHSGMRSDERIAKLQVGEAVINRSGARRNKEAIETMNKGGAVGQAQGNTTTAEINFNVQAIDAVSFNSYLASNRHVIENIISNSISTNGVVRQTIKQTM